VIPSVTAGQTVFCFPNCSFSPPARSLVAETLTLERTLDDLVSQAYGLTPADNLERSQTSRLTNSRHGSA